MGWTRGKPIPPEVRAKMSASHKARVARGEKPQKRADICDAELRKVRLPTKEAAALEKLKAEIMRKQEVESEAIRARLKEMGPL